MSELTGLNLSDIDQKERMLRVRGKGNKKEERIVPLRLEGTRCAGYVLAFAGGAAVAEVGGAGRAARTSAHAGGVPELRGAAADATAFGGAPG